MNHSASTQRARILDYLRIHNRMTTLEAREKLDILHPAARVQELRDSGYAGQIVTEMQWQENAQGYAHRVGVYVMINAPGETRHGEA